MLTKQRSRRKTVIIVAAIIAVVLCGTTAAYYLFYIPKNKDAASTYGSASTSPTDNTPTADQSQTNSSTSSAKGSSETASDLDESVTPVKPAGTFVSNHRPSVSGNSSPSQENSTCSTTPGAQCSIQFEKDGVIKSLPSKTTDSNGNTSWDWDIKSLGLSEGSWTITAIAKNGTKTSSSTDEINLQVQP